MAAKAYLALLFAALSFTSSSAKRAVVDSLALTAAGRDEEPGESVGMTMPHLDLGWNTDVGDASERANIEQEFKVKISDDVSLWEHNSWTPFTFIGSEMMLTEFTPVKKTTFNTLMWGSVQLGKPIGPQYLRFKGLDLFTEFVLHMQVDYIVAGYVAPDVRIVRGTMPNEMQLLGYPKHIFALATAIDVGKDFISMTVQSELMGEIKVRFDVVVGGGICCCKEKQCKPGSMSDDGKTPAKDTTLNGKGVCCTGKKSSSCGTRFNLFSYHGTKAPDISYCQP